jgi:hypothetical protein
MIPEKVSIWGAQMFDNLIGCHVLLGTEFPKGSEGKGRAEASTSMFLLRKRWGQKSLRQKIE